MTEYTNGKQSQSSEPISEVNFVLSNNSINNQIKVIKSISGIVMHAGIHLLLRKWHLYF